jgi:NADH:ubiquinone oxidoreductase subunit K
LLVLYLLTLGCGLASLIFTGILWTACTALGDDAALGPQTLAIFALIFFAIHLAVGLALFTQQKNRWRTAIQSVNSLISLLLVAVPIARFCIRVLIRSRHSTRQPNTR